MNLFFRLLWLSIMSPFRTRVSIMGPSRTPFTVFPTDLDLLMHMNNGVYFSILDLARIDLMKRAGMWSKLNKGGYYPVVAAETIQFQRSLEPFQRFEVETTLLGLDTKAFYIQQKFLRKGKHHATAVISARFIHKKRGPVDPHEIIALSGETSPVPELPGWVADWSKSMLGFREKS